MKLQSKIFTLSDGWKIVLDPNNVGKAEKWYKTGIPLENAKDAVVPSYAHLYFEDPRGICWYELNFKNELAATENDLYILKFAMAEFRKELYINGKYVGEHVGSEDAFEFDVTKFMKMGNNRITVRVSKPHKEDVDGYHFYSIPHRNELPVGLRPGQCYNAMGLHGQIDLVVTPKLYIEDSFIFANTETGKVEVKYTIINAFDKPVSGTILTECSVKRTGEYVNFDQFTKTFDVGVTTLTRKVKIDNFLWWDIDDPNLYNVNMTLSTEYGAHKTRKHTGFRTFLVGEDGYYYLNGRRIFLRCSHTGNCMPESFHHLSRKKDLLRKDFYMAKAVGFNMVRFISGVALPEQLDYCDELGLMVYEEPLSSWNLHDYIGKNADAVYREDLLKMMKRDRSHPCVTIFGFLNETSARYPHGQVFGKVYYYARQSLKAARKVDPTRLFLYSSGRWDGPHMCKEFADPWCGSVSNPFTTTWQCLWNEESEEPDFYKKQRIEAGLPEVAWRILGDIHHYPAGPIQKHDEARMREVGSFTKRPVFYSEVGTGSMLNVVWLKRKFEEMNALSIAPDVKIVDRMYNEFIRDLKRFGFDNEYPSLLELFRRSEVLNNRQRNKLFNIMRSNPHTNGVSLTGLLDHSVCGEGFFTFMREYKPGMADTLQNGFAPVKWCLFMNDTHAYRGRPFNVEAVLANEDVLKEGEYPVSFRIIGKDGGAVYSEDFTFQITAEDTKYFSVPVYKKDIVLDVPTGEYEVVFELMKGAGATDGNLKFYITDPDDIKASATSIVGIALTDRTKAFLAEKGVTVTDLSCATATSVIVVGEVPVEQREETWKDLKERMENGARVLALSEYAFFKGPDLEEPGYYLPLEKKPVSWPLEKDRTADWLYHKEYLLKRNHPYFEGLPTGMMDLDYYTYVISGHVFDYINCDVVPDEVQSIAMSAGLPWGLSKRDEIQENGVNIGTYHIGKGALTINTFRIEGMIGKNPAAERLLINMINEETKRASGNA